MTIRLVVCRLLLAGFTALPLTFHAADAAAAGKKIALTTFSGWKAGEVREWVESALDNGFTVVDAPGFKPGKKAGAYAKLASELGVDAILVGKQLKGRVAFTLRGKDGAVLKEWSVTAKRGPKLKAAIEDSVPKTLAGELGQSAAEPEPEPAKTAAAPKEESSSSGDSETTEASSSTPEGDEEPASSEDAGSTTEESADDSSSSSTEAPEGGTGAPFVLGFGVRFQNRKLNYNDTLVQLAPDRPIPDPANVLQDYTLGLQPVIALDLALYPGAFFESSGFLSNVGLVGGFEYGVPVTSKYVGSRPGIPQGTEFKNKTQQWYGGTRVRIPSASNEFGISVTYGKHSFELDGDRDDNALIPDTTYGYVRLGADAWFSFGKLFVGVNAAPRFVLNTGKLEDKRYWFENAKGFGFDAGLSVGYEIIPLLSILLGGNITRYAFDFNPVSKNQGRVAGGAVDQYISGFVGLRFAFGSDSSRGFGLNAASVSVEAGASADAEAESSSAAETDDGGEETDEAGDEEAAE